MKGITNNPNGRPKGSLNRTTASLKSKMEEIVNNQFLSLESDLELLDPRDRINFTLKLVEFLVPKMRETKIDFNSLSDNEIDELINRLQNPNNNE